LRALYDDRRDLYFYAKTEDERLQAAVQEEPFEEPDTPADTTLPEQEIRAIVRDEICRLQQ